MSDSANARESSQSDTLEYCRLVKKNGTLNVTYVGSRSQHRFQHNLYHNLVDLPWSTLVAIITVGYTAITTFFAVLFYLEGGLYQNESSFHSKNADATFLEAYFFSVQTQDTIGYGVIYPGSSILCNLITALQSWTSMLVYSALTGLMFTKLSRPSEIKNNIIFSSNAVINNTVATAFIQNKDSKDVLTGEYKQSEQPCLVFRIANVRKAQLCAASFALLCVKYKPNSHGEDYITQEMNFELNQQVGRVRGLNFSVPSLNLPWNVVHPIDKSSPLYGLTVKEIVRERIEIIAILDAIDEACGDNFQARCSYTANDIHWQAEFAGMLTCVRKGQMSDYLRGMRRSVYEKRKSITSSTQHSSETLADQDKCVGLRKLINDATVISNSQPVSPAVRAKLANARTNRRRSVDGMFLQGRESGLRNALCNSDSHLALPAPKFGMSFNASVLPSPSSACPRRRSVDVHTSGVNSQILNKNIESTTQIITSESEAERNSTSSQTSSNTPKRRAVNTANLYVCAEVGENGIVNGSIGGISECIVPDSEAEIQTETEIQDTGVMINGSGCEETIYCTDGVIVADFSMFDTVEHLDSTFS
eukprot:CFRG0012T1